jgi:hypothetical protein
LIDIANELLRRSSPSAARPARLLLALDHDDRPRLNQTPAASADRHPRVSNAIEECRLIAIEKWRRVETGGAAIRA